MKVLLCFLCCSVLSLGAAGQSTVSGRTVDPDKQPLPSATAALLHASDSVLVQFTLSDVDGRFVFNRVPAGAYLVQVSYMGFNTNSTPVSVEAGTPVYNLGDLELESSAERLGAAEVVGEAIPIVFKEDTVEYNADSFNTGPNDNVEKLLKQLPGVEVGKDGRIKAQGEEVDKVLVDGKEFFGGDAKIATQNLPADAIEKVQVYDKQSEESEFTGVDDGEREKTINLTLKEDKKKGGFGELMAGAGNPDLFDSKLSVNRFNNKMQLAGLGMYNNINKQGFGFGDYIDFAGGFQNAFAGGFNFNPDNLPIPVDFGDGSGLSTNLAGGGNLNYDFSDKLKLESSAFYNTTDRTLTEQVDVQGTTSASDYLFSESRDERGNNENIRGNVKLKWTPDSLNQLIVSGNVRLNDFGETLLGSNANLGLDGTPISNGSYNTTRGSDILSAGGNLSYTRNFAREGRSLSIRGNARHYVTDGNDRVYNEFNDPVVPTNSFTTDQRQVRDQVQDEFGGSVRFTEPLGEKAYLTLRTSFTNRTETWAKDFFDIQPDDASEVLNEDLSLGYAYTYTALNTTAGIRYLTGGWNLFAQGGVQRSTLQGATSDTENRLARTFLLPVGAASAFKKISSGKKIRFNYRAAVREPSLVDLQPTANNSDPLNIYIGNPDLRPESNHTASLFFNSYTRFSGVNINAGVRGGATSNPITQSVEFDENLRRVTSPVNAPLGWNSSLFWYSSIPWQAINIEFDLDAQAGLNERYVYLDGLEDISSTQSIELGGGIGIYNDDWFDWDLGYNLEVGTTTYALNTNASQEFTNHNLYAELAMELGDNWFFEIWGDYFVWDGDFAAPDQLIINAGLERYFGEGQRFWLSLEARDILGQNNQVNRSVGSNFVQQTQSNLLTQYVMLRAHWKLSKFSRGSGMEVEVD